MPRLTQSNEPMGNILTSKLFAPAQNQEHKAATKHTNRVRYYAH